MFSTFLVITLCAFFATPTNSVHLITVPHESFYTETAAKMLQQYSKNLLRISSKEHQIIINSIADVLIKEVSFVLKQPKFDPISIPDVTEGFEYSVFNGYLNLKRGLLRDLHTIHRSENVTLSREGMVAILEVPVAFTDFWFKYDYSAKFVGVGPVGTLNGQVIKVDVCCELSVDAVNKKMKLEDFQITEIGRTLINFDGNTGLDWMLNLISDLAEASIKKAIQNAVQNSVADELRYIIDKINEAWNPL